MVWSLISSVLLWFLAAMLLPTLWVFWFRRSLSMRDKLRFVGTCAVVCVITIITFFVPWVFEIVNF